LERYATVLSRIQEWTARIELLEPYRRGEVDPRVN